MFSSSFRWSYLIVFDSLSWSRWAEWSFVVPTFPTVIALLMLGRVQGKAPRVGSGSLLKVEIDILFMCGYFQSRPAWQPSQRSQSSACSGQSPFQLRATSPTKRATQMFAVYSYQNCPLKVCANLYALHAFPQTLTNTVRPPFCWYDQWKAIFLLLLKCECFIFLSWIACLCPLAIFLMEYWPSFLMTFKRFYL